MADIDLDSMKRARQEALGKKRHAVKFGGKRFVLPVELPLEFASALTRGDHEAALRTVFDGKFDDFMAAAPTYGDFAALTAAVAELYTGQSLPQSSASSNS